MKNIGLKYKKAVYDFKNSETTRTLDEFRLGMYSSILSNLNSPTSLFVFFYVLYINFVKFNYDYEKETSEVEYSYIAVNPKNHNFIANKPLEYNFVGINYNIGNYVSIKNWNEDKQKEKNTLKLIKDLKLKTSSAILNFSEDSKILDTIVRIFLEFLSSKSGTNYDFKKEINFEVEKLKIEKSLKKYIFTN